MFVRSIRPGAPVAALLAAVLLPSMVLAQASSAVLTGNVVDAQTHAPVADVVVTATSPNLQGEQIVVTDSTGLYRIPQLPPGSYSLRFEKETYRPYVRNGIEVEADRTLRLNVEVLPEAITGEVISVTGAAPVVDVGSSTGSAEQTAPSTRSPPPRLSQPWTSTAYRSAVPPRPRTRT